MKGRANKVRRCLSCGRKTHEDELINKSCTYCFEHNRRVARLAYLKVKAALELRLYATQMDDVPIAADSLYRPNQRILR